MKTTGYALLALICFASHVDAETELERTAPDTACYNQNVLLTIWHAQRVIRHIEYEGPSAKVVVDHRGWLKSQQSVRTSIALAAYCRIRVEFGSGKINVADPSGSLYGTVVDGYWRDFLTD